jgi:hypothetical protein
MHRLLSLAAALAASVLVAACATPANDWQTLIDGPSGLQNWTSLGGANWHAEDGAIVADQRPGKESAFLLSRESYRDFQIHAEFWISPDANSGIYMRCADTRPLTDRTCYEANLFDARPDPSYGTGAITNIAKVDPMPKAAGRWGSYDITVRGDLITVVLNGVQTAQARDEKLAAGPFALQYAGGVVKFRKVQIRRL